MNPIDLNEIQARIEAQQAVCAPTSPEIERRALPQQLTETVWQLMSSMFGHRWTSSFGDAVDPDRVWAATLHGLDETQIRYGLRQCVNLGLDWPPSAPEFRALCTGESDVSWEHRRIEAANREHAARPRLPDLTADERRHAHGLEQIDNIRDILRMPPRSAA